MGVIKKMSTTRIKFIDIPNTLLEKGAPTKITINERDVTVLKNLFPSFFKDSSVYEYWSCNKLGELKQVPVCTGVNTKQHATLYW